MFTAASAFAARPTAGPTDPGVIVVVRTGVDPVTFRFSSIEIRPGRSVIPVVLAANARGFL
jgi:hypothetical protein